MNKKYTINLEVLVGRPGSGKSVYAKERKDIPDSGKIHIVDCDSYFNNNKNSDESFINSKGFIKFLRQQFNNIYDCVKCWSDVTYIIDGLFLTNESRKVLINEILTCIVYNMNKNVKDEYNVNLKFIEWNNDIDACLANDRRRAQKEGNYRSAKTTISYAVFEPVDISIYKNHEIINNVSIMKMSVYSPSVSEDKIMSKASYGETKYLKSNTWCLGGEWCDYTGECEPVSAEEPLEFVEFDDLLTDVCPNISFLQYKKLRRECVEQCTEIHHDYYGGSTEEAYWKCNLEKLYNLLVEMNIIEK